MAINENSMYGRSYGRDFEASPFFQWKNNNALSSGSKVGIDWEFYNTKSKKYLPFNTTRIINNGEYDINFYPNKNEDNPILVVKGTIISLDKSSLPALSSFLIENLGDADITANKIVVTNSREGQTQDSVISRLHQKLFAPKFGGI